MTSPLDVRALRERIETRLADDDLLAQSSVALLGDMLAALSALEQERDRLRKVIRDAHVIVESESIYGSAWAYLEKEIGLMAKVTRKPKAKRIKAITAWAATCAGRLVVPVADEDRGGWIADSRADAQKRLDKKGFLSDQVIRVRIVPLARRKP